MTLNSPLPENAADFRTLYRIAEARSARLRLLFDVARDLATADDNNLEQHLQLASERAAHFLGFALGRLQRERPETPGPRGHVLDLHGSHGTTPCAYIVLENGTGGSVHQDDVEAVSVLRQLMAARILAQHRESEREHLLHELADREARLAALIGKMIADDEGARRRLAADLHDGVAQVAGAALRRLEIVDDIRDQLPAAQLLELDRGVALVRQTVRELRSLIQGLRPVTLENLGLAAALREELPSLIDVPVVVTASEQEDFRPPPDIEMTLFRCAQEAVHNARKHATACTRIEVRLLVRSTRIVLEVANDGAPIESGPPDHPGNSAPGEGLGLLMMRERIAAIGGSAQIAPKEGGGFRIRIDVSLASPAGPRA